MNIIQRWWLAREKRKHAQAIEAYQEIPTLLKDMHQRQIELAEELRNHPPFPPEQMHKLLQDAAVDAIKTQFPSIWPDIEKLAEQTHIDVNEVALYVFSHEIAPVIIDKAQVILANLDEQIAEICETGVDNELSKISEINKKAK